MTGSGVDGVAPTGEYLPVTLKRIIFELIRLESIYERSIVTLTRASTNSLHFQGGVSSSAESEGRYASARMHPKAMTKASVVQENEI